MPEREDVSRNYGFFLELQGERAGYFLKVEGLGAELDTIEYREGGMPSTVHKVPGRTHVKPITLSQGITRTDALWKWFNSCVLGKIERRNVSIVLLAPDGVGQVMRWNLGNAWLSAYNVKDFDALGNDVLISELTLQAETLEWMVSGATA